MNYMRSNNKFFFFFTLSPDRLFMRISQKEIENRRVREQACQRAVFLLFLCAKRSQKQQPRFVFAIIFCRYKILKIKVCLQVSMQCPNRVESASRRASASPRSVLQKQNWGNNSRSECAASELLAKLEMGFVLFYCFVAKQLAKLIAGVYLIQIRVHRL